MYWLLFPAVPFLYLQAAVLCGQAGEGVKYQMGLSMDELGCEVQEEVKHL
jgi:hypothetical protein